MAVLLGDDEGDGLFLNGFGVCGKAMKTNFWENNFINYARETIC